jgi:molecular chaperone GrpE
MLKKTKLKNIEMDLLKSQLVRALADYDNLIKRVEREKNDIEKLVSLRLILRLLTVLDGLESAQEHLKDQGLAISLGEFKQILNEEGLTEIRPKVGDQFDQETMEVVEVAAGENDNSIAEIVLVGWKYSEGSVVRHAKVKVIKKQ